jgi:hypothetical protein
VVLVAAFALFGVLTTSAPPSEWVALACVGVLHLLRRVSAQRAPFTVGPFVASPMGLIPLGLVIRYTAGFDVLLAAGGLLLGASPITAAVILTLTLAGYLVLLTARGH